MKIIIPGGSGHLGELAAAHFHPHHEVVVLSRHQAKRPWQTMTWDGVNQGPWSQAIDGADVVLNLAGRSVNCRYTAANRRQIMESRTDSTRALGMAIKQAENPPKLWLQMSTATIYAHTFDTPNDEINAVYGATEPTTPNAWNFSVRVAQAWEQEARHWAQPTRLILLRTAMVMSNAPGGPFQLLTRLANQGLGGPVAGGRQYMSWIHQDDFLRALDHLIANQSLSGPVNLAAPNPLPQRDFAAALKQSLGKVIALPATRAMVELGCLLMRTESELILKSRRVVPGRLLNTDFKFNYPNWPQACDHLINNSIAS